MKAITIWRPWASLIACGAKKFETRSWATKYRGQIAIHAALTSAHELDGQTSDAIAQAFGDYAKIEDYIEALPHGAVIATADLVGCHKIVLYGGRGLSSTSTGWIETDRGTYDPTERELSLGDWRVGRYAWELSNVQLLPATPIPATGKQGLWTWEGQM